MRGSRQLRLLLVLLLLTAFTLTALDYRAGDTGLFASLRRGADAVFGPAQRAVGGAARSVGDALGGLPNLGRYQDENEQLRDEVAQLRTQLAETDDLRRLEQQWNDLLKLKDYGTYTVVPARVAALGSALGFERTVVLDAGQRDGVRVDQPVVNGQGLVGRVARVGPYTCTVVLVTDALFTVGVKLDRRGTIGLADGDGDAAMELRVPSRDGKVEVGDLLLTSGSSVAVPGIPVGKVTAVRGGAGALARRAEVDPLVDLGSLDLVGVITDGPRSTPRLPIPPSPLPAPRPTATPAPSGTPQASSSPTPTSR